MVYVEPCPKCMAKKDYKIDELKNEIESLEEKIASLEDELTS